MKASEKINRDGVEDIIGLSPPQEGLLYDYLSDSGSYCEQISFHLNGNTDFEVIKKTWDILVEGNQPLRTVFRWEGIEVPVQIILKKKELQLNQYDLKNMSERQLIQTLEHHRLDERLHINLQNSPFRILLCRLPNNEVEMTLTYHHIILDGWSTSLLLKEFVTIYQSVLTGKASVLEPKTSYKTFVSWYQKQSSKEQNAYWESVLSEFEWMTIIPREKRERASRVQSNKFEEIDQGSVRRKISDSDFLSLKKTAQHLQTTLSTLFYAAWAVLLQRYGNVQDVVFGTTVSGRKANIAGIDRMTGLFSNTIPLRVKSVMGDRIKEVVSYIDESLKGREAFESTPLADIISASRKPVGNLLFDTIVVIENYPLDNVVSQQYTMRLDSTYKKLTFPMALIVYPFNGLELELQFDSIEFDQSTVESVLDHYILTLIEFTYPENSVDEIDWLSEKEKSKLISHQGKVNHEISSSKTVYELFEKQVVRTPDQIAVLYGERSITYRDLNDRANQLANKLISKGVTTDQPVAVMVERSFEMMIGLLGILKAGGAYVPIDPTYPEERITYLLNDSQTRILLTDGRNQITYSGEVVDLTDPNLYQGTDSLLKARSGPTDLTYIIYTSGSTGNPKGVMIEHRSVINRLQWMQKRYLLSEKDVVLQKTSISFDVSVWELFWWGIAGASVAFLKQGEEKDPAAIVQAIKQYGVTVMHFVPSMLQLFLEYLEQHEVSEEIRSLRVVFSSGEPLRIQQAQVFSKVLPWVQLVNLYGPTEATVDVSYHEFKYKNNSSRIPIGRPIDNTNLYVMDSLLREQPVGVPGELYIGGIAVARGYWMQPELTSARFIKHPTNTQERIYRTGDLVLRLPNGEIDYLRRIDNQLKIRGYRIEPGEIEHVLIEHPSVRHALVTVKQVGGQPCLCAYIILDSTETDLSEIKVFASKYLPSYMLPTFLVPLKELPLTSNQKVDLSMLPEPTIQRDEDLVTPQSEMEKQLIKLWSDVLKINSNEISILDHFFDIGGNSILLMRLLAKVQKQISSSALITDLFANPTIREMALLLSERTNSLSHRTTNGFMFEAVLTGQGRRQRVSKGFEMSFAGELLSSLKGIATLERMEVDVILLAMFLYQLSEATSSELDFDTIFKMSNEFVPIQMRVDDIDSFSTLFLDTKVALSGKGYPLEKQVTKNENLQETVRMLIGKKEKYTQSLNPLELYDVILFFVDGNGKDISLTIEFNASYIRDERLERLLEEYLHSVQQLVEYYRMNTV
ncbi:iturin family lipopeptide synthetase C [Paenibacillus sp. CF095]|uniref:non-ribosomal peptide synthetase n=1 Tax=Paenibacillus sp. CF095 TaxID=1881033 RepID=UPI00087E76CB|nr:non-ribosomal peptide synthetase [Paenibacillus sp. CF095]SDD50880.1 iturin family lipopeptide synthetase C [Paenibacillus sp. CF095]